MSRTSFLAIGHASRDEFPDGRWRLGGSALYGAATAAKLGADVTLVTRVGPVERGFIRAEVIRWDDLLKAGSEANARKQALLRTEGKAYAVSDGDVVNVLFNV